MMQSRLGPAKNAARADADARDALLIGQIAAGDEVAFAAFYRSYERRLFSFIQKKMNDPFEAADILHITFMDVWKNAASFEQRSRVSTWLFGIAYRKVVDRFRKNIPTPVDIDEEFGEIVSSDPSAFETLNAQEEAGHVRYCISTLKPNQRSVIELAFFEHMAYGEIATVMQCPEGTVKTRIMHAKAALKTCISKILGRRS